MNLVEASFIKKFENNIGDAISDVGGEVPYDLHWLNELDDVVRDQLVGDFIIDEKIDERLRELGITPEAVESWNLAVNQIRGLEERVVVLERFKEDTTNKMRDYDESTYWQED